MVLILHDDRLFRSPLENPQSVLDIGTGTGNWAVYVDAASVAQSGTGALTYSQRRRG